MLINTLEFADLQTNVLKTHRSYLELLAPEMGKAYVIAITRDECSACKRQKPKLEKLAKILTEKHGSRVVFTQVHVRRPANSDKESLRSKDLLGHYFYPTNLILLKTQDRGAIEYHRSVSPRMSDLKRSIETAIEIATMLEKEKS